MRQGIARILLCALGAILLVALPAAAQDADSSAGTAASSASAFSLSLTGEHELVVGMPVGSDSWSSGYDGAMKLPRMLSDVGLTAGQGPVRLVTSWEIQSTSLDGSSSSYESLAVKDLETYISWAPGAFRFTFGYQVFAWGTADGVNPTDNINPQDYTTLEGDKIHKLPVLALGATWYPSESCSLDTVLVPYTLDSDFPLDVAASLEENGTTASYATISDDPENFVAGAKLNFRTTAVDFSFSYLYDFDRLYTPVVADDFSVSLERKRVHRLGADMKTTLGPFGLWAEACYSLTGNQSADDYTERLSSLAYTVGMDVSYGPDDNYYLNLQYTGTVVPGYDSSANTYSIYDKRYLEKELLYSIADFEGGVTQGVVLKARWTLANGAVVPSVAASYSRPFDYDSSSVTYYGSLLLKPEVDFMPVDSFHITFGSILAYSWVKYAGGGLTLDTADSVGVYTPQNHLFLSVSYKWNYDR